MYSPSFCVLFVCLFLIGKTVVVVVFLIFDCSLVFPTAQLVSACYYPVNVLFTQVPALFSDLFFFPGHSIWLTLSLFVAQICDRK